MTSVTGYMLTSLRNTLRVVHPLLESGDLHVTKLTSRSPDTPYFRVTITCLVTLLFCLVVTGSLCKFPGCSLCPRIGVVMQALVALGVDILASLLVRFVMVVSGVVRCPCCVRRRA